MVCIPCFIVPVLLFIWHKFIQPYVLRYWNPWAKKDAQGNVVGRPEDTKFPIDCSGGTCVFQRKGTTSATDTAQDTATADTAPEPNKKDD